MYIYIYFHKNVFFFFAKIVLFSQKWTLKNKIWINIWKKKLYWLISRDYEDHSIPIPLVVLQNKKNMLPQGMQHQVLHFSYNNYFDTTPLHVSEKKQTFKLTFCTSEYYLKLCILVLLPIIQSWNYISVNQCIKIPDLSVWTYLFHLLCLSLFCSYVISKLESPFWNTLYLQYIRVGHTKIDFTTV